MVRKKLRCPLWRWDRYSYEEGLMAPLDANGSFIPGKSTSSIHSIYQIVTNLHPSFSLNNFHHTISSPRTQGPIGGQRLEPAAKKSSKHVSFFCCCISKCTLVPWIELTFNLGILAARPAVSKPTTRKWRRYRKKSMRLQWAALRWTTSSLWWELENANIRA